MENVDEKQQELDLEDKIEVAEDDAPPEVEMKAEEASKQAESTPDRVI